MHSLPDREKLTAPNVRRGVSGRYWIVRYNRDSVSLSIHAFVREFLKDAMVDIDVTCQDDNGFMVISRTDLIVVLMGALAIGVFKDTIYEPAVPGICEHDLFPVYTLVIACEMNRCIFRPNGEEPPKNNKRSGLFHTNNRPRFDV